MDSAAAGDSRPVVGTTSRLHIALTILLASNVAVIFAWPAMRASPLRELNASLYAHTCHQISERCYRIGGEPLPVYARCLGVWIGLTAAAAAASIGGTRSPYWTLRTACGLLSVMGASWLLGYFVFPESWRLERGTLSGLCGGLGTYIACTIGISLAYRSLRKLHAALVRWQ